MTSDFLSKAESLRQEAWQAVLGSKEYAVFKAMDAAVTASGGTSLISEPLGSAILDGVQRAPNRTGFALNAITAARAFANGAGVSVKRVSQGDAAELALIRAEAPQQASDLLIAATAEGAAIGGEKPIVNFTSTLSKDPRFYSFRRGGAYYWWLHGVTLPPNWIEPESDDFERLMDPGSSVSTSQEGGEANAPATS